MLSPLVVPLFSHCQFALRVKQKTRLLGCHPAAGSGFVLGSGLELLPPGAGCEMSWRLASNARDSFARNSSARHVVGRIHVQALHANTLDGSFGSVKSTAGANGERCAEDANCLYNAAG
jgi:hypothetical protein